MDLHSNHFSLSGIDPSLSLSLSFSLNFLTSFLNFLMKLKEEKIMGEFFLCLKGFSCSFCSFVSLLPLDGLSRILAALPRACLALANGSRGVEVQQVPGSCLVSFFSVANILPGSKKSHWTLRRLCLKNELILTKKFECYLKKYIWFCRSREIKFSS